MVHVLIVAGFLPIHSDSPLGVFAWGTVGQMLDMLFIISGFVIFLPTVARGGDFGSVAAFAVRRSARLLPAYWLVLTLILILIATVSVEPPIPFPTASEIFLNYTFLEVPAEFFRNTFFLGFEVNRAIWTLWSEVCFYLLLPFVAGWYFRHPFVGLAIGAGITAAWKLAFSNLGSITAALGLDPSDATLANLVNAADIQFPAWVFSITLGMTGAWVYVRVAALERTPALRRRVIAAQVISLIALAGFAYNAGQVSVDAPFLTAPEFARHSALAALGLSAALASLMLSISLGPAPVQRPFDNRPARWIADNSVGMYLIHLVFTTYIARLFSLPSDGSLGAVAAWCAVIFPLTLLYGWLSARLLERPVRRRAQRLARRFDSQSRAGGSTRAAERPAPEV